MPTDVLILGAGFGGLEVATRLSAAVPDQVRVTLVDQSDAFVFGFSKLDVLFGHRQPDGVRCWYRDIHKPSVEFRQERVLSIDPERKHVETSGGAYDPDVLVVAMGADLDPAATPGLAEGGHEFYSPEGAARAASAVAAFEGGVAVVAVLGSFFKCPPAPNETAFMLHDHLARRGVRDAATITIVSPLGLPIPISHEVSSAILDQLAARDITYRGGARVTHIDGAAHVAHLSDGESLDYDLLLGIPVHVAPEVVVRSGLTDDGWIAVDPATFLTKFPDVYAVGDITSAPVPRAGIIAEGEGVVVAEGIVARLTGATPPPPYEGQAICYIEMGDRTVGRVDVNFLAEGAPTAVFTPNSLELAEEKRQFGSTRRQRWFGYDE